jgi:PAS domain S-box-containing protein
MGHHAGIVESFASLLSPEFMPHGYCYLWDPWMVWLHVIADGLIALSYYCIPIILVYFIRKNRDLPFNRIFWMFGGFILACGTTHLMEIWNVWHGSYLLAGIIKGITAAVSVVTALMLIPLVPRVISVPGRMQLEEVNRKLEEEVAERKWAEEVRGRLSAVVESSDDAIIGKTLEGTITSWNRGAEKVFGYTSAEALGKSMRMLLPPDRVNEESDILARIGRGERVEHFETIRVRKDGKRIDVSVTISPIKDSSGTIIGASKIARDITERKRTEQSLRKSLTASEVALQELADQKFALDQHAIVAITDVQGTITYVNDKFCAISQYSEDELIGQNHRLLNSGHHPKEFFQEMYQTIANGRVWHGEIRNRAKDGSKYWVDTTIVPFIGRDGKPRQYIAIRADITERKRGTEVLAAQALELSRYAEELTDSQDALQRQTLMLQSVLDSMSEGLVVADENGKFIIWNPAAEEIVGLPAANLTIDQWTSHYGLFSPDTVTPFPAEQNPLLRAVRGELCSAEMFLRNPELAEGVWIEASAGPLKDKDGAVHGGVTAFRDITQRKKDEQEIRKLNDELELRVIERTAQLEAANRELADQKFAMDQHAIVALTGVDGVITYVNDKFCAISKYSREELIGQDHRILNSGHHSPIFFKQMYDTIAGGNVWRAEVKNRAKDGSVFWLDTTVVPFMDAEGKPRQYAAIRADITELKQAEERDLRRTAELEAANKELEAFSYSVSHDLRAPLRHIGGFSKMLVEEFGSTLDPTAQHYLDRIQAGAQKMGLLVDELLNLARVGRRALTLQPAKLNAIVAEVIAMLQAESEGRSVEWVIADLPVVECDPVLVKQVFQNLLANALKFTSPAISAGGGARAGTPAPARAIIEISCAEDDGLPVIMVRDNGIGFDMKYVDKLFGVFQRLHRAEDFEGTGIGLATVQSIVQKHGGRVWAEGEVGKGAAFYFTLSAGKQVEVKSNGATAGGRL